MITIDDKELLRRIGGIQKLTHTRAAVKAAAIFLRGKIAKYPPASEANSPGMRRWYQRGYGPKWRTRDGAVHGRATSKKLGQSWTYKFENAGMRGIVGTLVDYAPFVQDRDEQARFHKWRGWITVQGVEGLYGREAIEFVRKGLMEDVTGKPS